MRRCSRPVPAIDLPPGQTVTLAPGGLHLMLIGLTHELRQGERVPVTLTLERGGSLTVPLEVLAAGARGPTGAGGQGGATTGAHGPTAAGGHGAAAMGAHGPAAGHGGAH